MKAIHYIKQLIIIILSRETIHISQIKTLKIFQPWIQWDDYHQTLAYQEAAIQNNFSSFGLLYSYQYNPSCPLTFEEYIDKLYEIDLRLIIANERFDPSNREEPIKRLITDQYSSSSTPKMFNYYNMFIGMNTYEIESGIFTSQKTGKFYTVSRESTHSSEIRNSSK